MAWWILLIPAIAVLIQSLPYLIGGGIAVSAILSNPTAIVSVIAAGSGAYLIYKKKTKEATILFLISGILFVFPQISIMFKEFLGWSVALFSNVFFMLIVLGGVLAYFLASQKKLTGKYAVYIVISIVAASIVYMLLSNISFAGGGVSPIIPEWYEVTVRADFTTWRGKAKATAVHVLDYNKVSYCVEEIQPLFVTPTKRQYTVKVINLDTGRTIMKTLTAEWGWLQINTYDVFQLCLKEGSYKIIVYALDTPEYRVETTLTLKGE